MSMMRRGFTLVELIVVIAVIGILATVSLIGFSRFQADARDSRRASAVVAITEALEKYYDTHGEYPSCEDVMAASSTLTTETLVGLQKSTVVAPQAASGQSNSIECGVTLTVDGEDFYLYTGDGSISCNTNASCLNYAISYKSESENTIKTVNSRRNTAIATSGAAQLSTTNTRFTTIGLSWTDVQNAAGYTVQSATNAAFTAGLTEYNANTATTFNVTGLSAGTNYWFRVKPTNVTGQGLWSNTLPATTLTMGTPSVTANPASNTQINVSWGGISNATSYTLQYSTSAGMTSPTTIANISTTSRSVTGLSTGTAYYFQVRADSPADSYSGAWSSIVSAVTTITPPPSYTITETGRTWNSLSAISNATCPNVGATLYYQWYVNGNPWIAGSSYQSVTYSGISWNQDISLTVSTRCEISGSYSVYTAASNSLSHTTLDSPYAWAGNCAYRTACWDGSCPAYTTSGYINWVVRSSSFGTASSNAGVGYGTWVNNNAAWGNGNVRSTTYCSGPWGTVTAGGWGPFGSGCVPTITTAICTQ